MTGAENRKRWSVHQKKLAHAQFAASQAARDEQKREQDRKTAEAGEFMNMFLGYEYSRWLPKL